MNRSNRLRQRSILLLTLLLVIVSPATGPGQSSSRTALIIGNGDYAESPLRNPVNDSRDMAEVLRHQGFSVTHLENADRSSMRQAIRDFEETLSTRKGTGLFYFAGHGVQVDGRNYLVPVGADIAQEYEVADETVAAESVVEAMAFARNEMNIVILDACRNNPFPRSFRSASRGLARMKTAGSGMLIAYATAPGAVALDGEGKNGLYTRHLLAAIATPNLSIEQVFKSVRQKVMAETNNSQTPWEESSLTGEFYFSSATPAPPAPAGQTANGAQPSAELMFWQGISASGRGSDYEEYLRRFPDGLFASLARARLESLDGKAATVKIAAAAGNDMVRSVGEYPQQLLATWQYSYTENKVAAYLQYLFAADGTGSVEGEDPDGSWWAEPLQWQVHNSELAVRYGDVENSYRIVAVAEDSLALLGLKGDHRDEQLQLQRQDGAHPPSFAGRTDQFVGTWKDTWQEGGKPAYQLYTLQADGSFQEQGESGDDRWSQEGKWRIKGDLLLLEADGETQKYRIVHIRDTVMDLIDLSPAYLGQGTRFRRADR